MMMTTLLLIEVMMMMMIEREQETRRYFHLRRNSPRQKSLRRRMLELRRIVRLCSEIEACCTTRQMSAEAAKNENDIWRRPRRLKCQDFEKLRLMNYYCYCYYFRDSESRLREQFECSIPILTFLLLFQRSPKPSFQSSVFVSQHRRKDQQPVLPLLKSNSEKEY